ncbi:nucleotide exchange factor GrpE [Candidatus Neomarinimicrobiota bacterium]
MAKVNVKEQNDIRQTLPDEADTEGNNAEVEVAALDGEKAQKTDVDDSEPAVKPDESAELTVEQAEGEPESDEKLEYKLLRLRAEYDNYRKRTSREKDELLVYAGSHFIVKMFPIIDDLTRTYEHGMEGKKGATDPVLDGLKMVLDKFRKTLKEEGVEEIESVGKEFDPNLHDALMSRESEDHPAGIVLEQFESGYIYHDRVLKHAKVIVSS